MPLLCCTYILMILRIHHLHHPHHFTTKGKKTKLYADQKSNSRGLRSQAFFSRRDETRLEVTSQIAETVTRLHMSGTVARENSGKIRDRTRLLSTTREKS